MDITASVLIRVLSWNLFHGRDAPPDPALRTWRSRLFRITERNATHRQVNRDLRREFLSVLAGTEWDLALLQECPPRWIEDLELACNAASHRSLTSRNSLPWLRAALARINPDLIASSEGGSNLILVQREGALGSGTRPEILERRELDLQTSPEHRTMAFARLASGVCVANLHATNSRPELAGQEVLHAARAAVEWAASEPLVFGGDLNIRPDQQPQIFAELRDRFGLSQPTSPGSIDHLLARGLEIAEPPEPWPGERREVPEGGLAIRLSDHAPVEAVFRRD